MIEKHGRKFASSAELRRFEMPEPGKYQLRLWNGEIHTFSNMMDLHMWLEKQFESGSFDWGAIEKLSFDGPDGERVRLTHEGHKDFRVTFWTGKGYKPL